MSNVFSCPKFNCFKCEILLQSFSGLNYKKLATSLKKIQEIENRSSELAEHYKEILRIVEAKEIQLKEKESELRDEIARKESLIINKENALKKIFEEKSIGFPWLAGAIADYYKFIDFEVANYLEYKSHPAYKRAEAVREVANDNRVLRKQLKIAQNFVNYYETIFPWINEYVGNDLDDLLEDIVQSKKDTENVDPVLKYIPRAEFNSLSTSDRNQKALDRYLESRKRPWEIGRDYERYIGYLYEQKGYSVEYIGIEKGLEDLGRDLICTKGNEVDIVQCKCWARHKVIHEKHINQLYGTAVKYYIENREHTNPNKRLNLFPDIISGGQIKATFVTSTSLSDTARKFANALGVIIVENKPLENYPMIKCNIGTRGDKIYHLPFDQQYDRTLIKNNGEFYAATVKEAEKKGFRRAFRWHGTND